MNKRIIPVVCAVMMILFTGCSAGTDKSASSKAGISGTSTTVNDVLEAAAQTETVQTASAVQETQADVTPPATAPQAETGTQPAKDETAAPAKQAKSGSDIDVDLTKLSATMVYTEVYNMMSMPENYMGKRVRMNGNFATYYTEATDTYYFACIIKDATACCSQGIEFVLDGDKKYPEDYPILGAEITVTGIFDTYMEGENMYCTLRHAKMA